MSNTFRWPFEAMMALTRIRLKNFKCFEDSGEMPLAPLTLIFGRNNTGKSSILQSLLLLRQTLESSALPQRLNLGGPLYAAGSYTDVVHKHQSKRRMTFEFDFVPGLRSITQPDFDFDPSRRANVGMEYCHDEPQPPRLTYLRVTPNGSKSVEFKRSRGAGGPFNMVVDGKVIWGERTRNFVFVPNRLFPLLRPVSDRAHVVRSIYEEFWWATERFETELRMIRAVGAFRQQPTRRYEFLGRTPETIDAAGVNVVNALIEDLTRRKRRVRGELVRSVNRWLKSVGKVRLLSLRRISRTAKLYEIRLKDIDSGRWANFADVGFGIGQAIPVLVEGLRTPQGGTFIVQEPEIHLHPDAQLAMADFLMDLAASGRHVIAETHSEHLLLRVRKLLLRRGRRRRGLSPDHVSLLYVDKTRDGASHVRRLPIDELGQVKSWPSGFMEEATEERMAIMHDVAARAD